MTYQGKLDIHKRQFFASSVYFQEAIGGNPPPTPPDRYLLQEDGNFLLQEDGNRILLESGTP